MAAPEKSALELKPGVIKTQAPYAVQGRWIDCDKILFKGGRPEKMAGWIAYLSGLLGVIRAIMAWDDNDDDRWLALGSNVKLYRVDQDDEILNITPLAQSGTLTDPFTMVNTETIVTVTDASHGRRTGDYVSFSGAGAVGGITIDGEYVVVEVIDSSTYTIEHSSPATSSAGPGGGSVDFEYELSPGTTNSVAGSGYGTGTYGMGTYGTPREGAVSLIRYPRIWSLDKYGENLLALPSGGVLYQWSPDTPSNRAAVVANAPAGNFMFVTNERFAVILGANDDLMEAAWHTQTDITNWTVGTATVPSTAVRRRLQNGSRLMAGANLLNQLNILWTDTACYTMQYTGAINIVYNTLLAGENCGLIGPKAFAVANGIAYWMGPFNFHMYSNGVQQIPNSEDIHGWLYEGDTPRLDPRQNWKCHGEYNAKQNYVFWRYVLAGEDEPRYYVGVSLDDYSWVVGTQERTAMGSRGGIDARIYGADRNGNVYIHETGSDDAGLAMRAFIESAPVDADDGNSVIDISGYVPNMHRHVGAVQLELVGYDYPEQTTPIDSDSAVITPGGGMADLRMEGRQVSIKLTSDVIGGDFKLGRHRFETSLSKRRR